MILLTNEVWADTDGDDEIQILSKLEMPTVSDLRTFDPEIKNKGGNPILHMVAYASWMFPNTNLYVRLYDVIVEAFVGDDAASRYSKHRHITTGVCNRARQSLLIFSLSLGAAKMADRILSTEGVYSFKNKTHTYYDVSHVLPMNKPDSTKQARIGPRDGSHALYPGIRPPCILKYSILDIDVVQQIAKVYMSVVDWIYIPLTIFHLIHMVLFTYSSVVLLNERANVNSTTDTLHAKVILYGFVPIEPALFFMLIIYLNIIITQQLFRFNESRFINRFILAISKGARIFSTINFAYNCLMCVFIARYVENGPEQNIILSLALLVGWLMILDFARGLRPFHYFSDMVWNMLSSLVTVSLVYIIFLIAFTFAFHVQLQISEQLREAFPTPGHTMFVIFEALLGEDQLFSQDFEHHVTAAGGSVAYLKILFTIYAVVCAILLLNLVIATLNSVYNERSTRKKLEWIMKSLELGMFLELCVPSVAVKIMKRKLIECDLGDMFDGPTGMNWYIKVPLDEEPEEADSEVRETGRSILERLDKLEATLKPRQATPEMIQPALDKSPGLVRLERDVLRFKLKKAEERLNLES